MFCGWWMELTEIRILLNKRVRAPLLPSDVSFGHRTLCVRILSVCCSKGSNFWANTFRGNYEALLLKIVGTSVLSRRNGSAIVMHAWATGLLFSDGASSVLTIGFWVRCTYRSSSEELQKKRCCASIVAPGMCMARWAVSARSWKFSCSQNWRRLW